jgi:hypothetical protein
LGWHRAGAGLEGRFPISSEFHAFGDESGGERCCSYAFVCVPEEEIPAFLKDIDTLRASRSLVDQPLHCRELFAADRRRKCGLESWSLEDVVSLYSDFASVIRRYAVHRVVAVAKRSDFPAHQPPTGNFPRAVFGSKQLSALCGYGAGVVLRHALGSRLQLWVDDDATQTEWLGKNSQASRTIGGHVDLPDGLGRMTPKQAAELEDPTWRPLFQAADFLAWAGQRANARSEGGLSAKVGPLYDAMEPFEARVDTGPDGGVRFRT